MILKMLIDPPRGNTLQHTATHCNTLQQTATDYGTQDYWLAAAHCDTQNEQHTAPHCDTTQHTATHCDTLHRMLIGPLHTLAHSTEEKHSHARHDISGDRETVFIM